MVAVGTTGSDVSTDGRLTWTEFSGEPLNAVECGEDGACWASGSGGTLARLIRK